SLVEIEDPGRDEPGAARWCVPDAPVALPLADRWVLGVAGEQALTHALARWLVVQAAVLHSPRDLQIQVLTAVSTVDSWGWIRWLPHAGARDGGDVQTLIGNDPETVANRVAELVALVKTRVQARTGSMASAVSAGPDVLLVVDGARRLREVPGMVQIL